MTDPLAPYDAVLVVSFGGPRSSEEVVPFLEHVSGGRIPPHRLQEVAEHYHRLGGASPINAETDRFVDALAAALRAAGSQLPVVLGNRHGTPFLPDTLRQLRSSGAQRVIMLPTTAFSSYSGCRQYREDAAQALREAGIDDLVIDMVPPFHEAPGFATANADAVMDAFGRIPPTPLEATRVVFVTHSIPQSMQDASGPGTPGTDYVTQHQQVARHIADIVRRTFGNMPAWDLAYCSRSGRPTDPWLEPDIEDHLRLLPAQGVRSVVVAPIGFVADHMEVVNDLDHDAARTASQLGLAMARAATAGTHPALVRDLVGFLRARAEVARGHGSLPGSWPTPCAAGCCQRGDGSPMKPAVCGSDPVVEPAAEPQNPTTTQEMPVTDAQPAPTEPVEQKDPAASLGTDSAAPTGTDHAVGSYTDPTDPRDHAVVPEEVNQASLWGLYSVFKVSAPLPADDAARAGIVTDSVDWVAASGALTRGWYDLGGLRADADLLVWWTADAPETLQEAYHRLRGSALGRHLEPVWSSLAVHRPAEFNKQHLPSCFAGVAPRRWAAVYPFVRTKDWYLLEPAERNAMLREHGMAGAKSPDVKASTLASFALGDYEWILALEGDELFRVVDVMKDLRYVQARRHVDVDTPFFTGERVDPTVWADRQQHR
ncbi:hydrogen peroxide-dependent heme synthase [Acidipropionibacterium timonense]|uniref:hydrogen peroxide-dependent heme synthase n=1 Tax=Acidipropionibacterium timonense TaxID=2161818 RepID=UPI00103031C3|nr:hydrogen peroxide-dependent heme synthase [Acidipropionibacterium timonense]